MGNKSFVIYDTDLKSMDFLTDAQIGKLFRAIKTYRLEGKTTDLGKNPALNMLYGQIMEHIIINEEKYKSACEKRSDAMKKRWDEKKSTIVDYSTLQSNIVEDSPLSDNDNENDNVNVNDNVNDNDNEHGALGEKIEKKRKKYSGRKPDFYSEGEPTYDIEAFTKKAIGIKYEKKERMNN